MIDTPRMTGTGSFVTDGDEPLRYQEIVIGIGLAIGGNLLISVSLNLQKYTHLKNESLENGEAEQHYTRSPLWWLGLLLMGLGELGNFSAYGFAPASLVAPLGTTTVVVNMFIAVLFLKEKLRPEDLFGCTLAVIGAFLLVNFSTKEETILGGPELVGNLITTSFIIYSVIEIVALVILLVIKYKFHIENVLVLLLICSLLASFTVISAKASSGMIQLTFAGHMQLHYAVFWVMVIVMVTTAVIQVKFLNMAMMSFDSTVVVPTNFVFFTISAITAGVIFYKEFWGMEALDIFMFLFGCVMSFGGVYFITAGRSTVQLSPEQEQEYAEDRRFLSEVFPSWLFSSVSQSDIHSRRQRSSVASDADNIPIISTGESDYEDLSSQPLPTTHELNSDDSLNLSGAQGKSYGSVQ